MNELKEAVYTSLGEVSGLFMSQPIKGTDIIMPAKELNKIGDYLMQLIESFTTRKELEARINELERLYLVYGSPEQPATLDNVFILGEKGKTATLPVKDRLNQLSTELKTLKEMK